MSIYHLIFTVQIRYLGVCTKVVSIFETLSIFNNHVLATFFVFVFLLQLRSRFRRFLLTEPQRRLFLLFRRWWGWSYQCGASKCLWSNLQDSEQVCSMITFALFRSLFICLHSVSLLHVFRDLSCFSIADNWQWSACWWSRWVSYLLLSRKKNLLVISCENKLYFW